MKLWSTVRRSAALIRKVADGLPITITDMIIRQKRLSLIQGHIISRPLNPTDIEKIIFEQFIEETTDIREAALVQELLIYMGSFIRAQPSLFDGILTIDIKDIIAAMKMEISLEKNVSEDDALDILMESSPHKVKLLVLQFLSLTGETIDEKRVEEPHTFPVPEEEKLQQPAKPLDALKGEWSKKRRVNGALRRVHHNFYPKVWDILAKSKGIKCSGKLLPCDPTVSEMTRSETNFALSVENTLRAVPVETHSLVVECLMALAQTEEAQPGINFNREIEVEKLVEDAIKSFWENQGFASKEPYANKVAEATQLFCDLPSKGNGSTRDYFIRAIMKHFPNLSDDLARK